MRSKFTSVALKKSVLARLDDLSGKIIPGIKISIPKTIEILTTSAQKELLTMTEILNSQEIIEKLHNIFFAKNGYKAVDLKRTRKDGKKLLIIKE